MGSRGLSDTGAVGMQTAASLIESNTLYSTQECLNRRTSAGFLIKNSASNPPVHRAKVIM